MLTKLLKKTRADAACIDPRGRLPKAWDKNNHSFYLLMLCFWCNLAGMSKQFEQHLRSRSLSSNTIRAYLSWVRLFDEQCGDLDKANAWVRGLSVSPSSKNQAAAALRAYGKCKGVLVKIPPIRNSRIANQEPDTSGISRLRGRKRLFMELLLATGMRVSEALSLRGENIHAGEAKIVGKGRKERVVFIPPDLLQRLPKVSGRLFPYSYSWAQRAAAEAGLRTHDPRHAFATRLNRSGANILAIRDLLGHSSVKTTALYTHPTLEDLKKNRELLGR